MWLAASAPRGPKPDAMSFESSPTENPRLSARSSTEDARARHTYRQVCGCSARFAFWPLPRLRCHNPEDKVREAPDVVWLPRQSGQDKASKTLEQQPQQKHQDGARSFRGYPYPRDGFVSALPWGPRRLDLTELVSGNILEQLCGVLQAGTCLCGNIVMHASTRPLKPANKARYPNARYGAPARPSRPPQTIHPNGVHATCHARYNSPAKNAPKHGF